MSDLRTAALLALEALKLADNDLLEWQLSKDCCESWAQCQVNEAIRKLTFALENTKVDSQAIAKQPCPPPEAQTEAEKIAYCAGWWAALEKARKEEPVMKPAGVVTSMVKGGVTWHIWPDQMPDGTTLYAAAPIIKPEIKEDNSVPQAQQFLYSAWAR